MKVLLIALSCLAFSAAAEEGKGVVVPDAPRIVNIVNFIRAVEPREPVDLLEPVLKQIELTKRHHLKATFLVQYDALLEDRFVKPLKELDSQYEIGGWFEIVQPQCEKAGIPWRGRYPWDWHVNVGFSVGYPPAEREKLVDVFMDEFRAKFGRLPESVGSWFLDAHTLGYMADKYGIVASCNCKDQFGTDGYTLWGGYWNGAYYPSRLNAFMPAQHAENQIPVPVFRMLGSDPIYQYDLNLGETSQSVITLEPVYSANGGGGNPEWVRWFFKNFTEAPCLNFNYTQVGQENSFGWKAMEAGLIDQCALLEDLQKQAKVRVETLGESGKWFKKRYPITPGTAVVAQDDWKNQGRQALWLSFKESRVGIVWENNQMRIRDIHLFNEAYPERYLDKAEESTTCTYDTLPIMDGFLWSGKDKLAGIRPVSIDEDGKWKPLEGRAGCKPEIKLSPGIRLDRRVVEGQVSIEWPLREGGFLSMIMESGSGIEFYCSDSNGKARARWGLEMSWDPSKKLPIEEVQNGLISYNYNGFTYELHFYDVPVEFTGDSTILVYPTYRPRIGCSWGKKTVESWHGSGSWTSWSPEVPPGT